MRRHRCVVRDFVYVGALLLGFLYMVNSVHAFAFETARSDDPQRSIPAKSNDSVHALPVSGSSTGNQDAPVTILEFSDFECPFSRKAAPVIQELLRSNPGKIRLVFRQNPLSFHSHSALAHEAALAAGAQGKFWEMHDLLFANQEKLSEADLLQYASQLHLDIQSFRQALESHLFRPLVDADIETAKGLGVTGTPTFFVNGTKIVGAQTLESFKAAVDQALGITNKTISAPVPIPQGAIEKVEVGSSQIRGAAQAPVTIIEFSDFQCPFCARAVPTLQQLAREYPSGVRWVFKNFPLDFHPDSMLAHKAALAAGEQGKFWEMHDLIFASQGAIRRDDLLQKAGQLGLDMKRFVTDLDSLTLQKVIDDEKAEGTRLGVTGTPTFFINGKRFVGAWPLDEYKKLVDAELKGGSEKPVVSAGASPKRNIEAAKPPNAASTPPASALPKVTSASFAAKGPEKAPITITWYCDLESPLGPPAAELVSQVMASYPEKVRVVFKNLPLEFHAHATLAHQAMLAAGAQGKFWQMQRLIFANQQKLTRDDLIADAKTLGIDQAKFIAALDKQTFQPVLDQDATDARSQGVYGVPVFFVNGKRLDGVQPLAMFKALIDSELNNQQVAVTGQ